MDRSRQPVVEVPFLIKLVEQHYRVQVISLRQLSSESGKYIYHIELKNQTQWLLRVVHKADKAKLIDLANLLLFFEQVEYPAERIMLTTQSLPIATADTWHIAMTTFLLGTPLSYTPMIFSLLGAAIGQLHALSSSLTYTPPSSSMLVPGERAFAEQQLLAVATLVPKHYVAQYELLQTALSSLHSMTDLPTSLIHGDCHPANALLTAPEQVTLLDWEEAGMGPAILDVGFLLMNCDGKAPWDALPSTIPSPNEVYLQAVINGYSHYHRLAPNELDYLLDAIRFRSLIFGACSFATSIIEHKADAFSQWWWTRYCMAEEIAEKARTYFEHIEKNS